MGFERIVVEGLGRLPQFCHATVAGNFVFVSGTLGTLPGGFELAPGGTGPVRSARQRRFSACSARTLRSVTPGSLSLSSIPYGRLPLEVSHHQNAVKPTPYACSVVAREWDLR